MTQATDKHAAAGAEARQLVARVAARAKRVLVTDAIARALIVALAMTLVLIVLDYVFRLPRAIRVLHLGGLGYLLYVLVRRVLGPAWRFRPGQSEVAMRIARVASQDGEARSPDAQEALPSGVELGQGGQQQPLADALALLAALDADTVARAIRSRRFVRTDALIRSGGALGALLFVLLVFGALRPDLTGPGLARTLVPFGSAEWPKRTEVVNAIEIEVHPIGEPLPLKALLTRTNLEVGRTEVAAFYRVVTSDGQGARQRVVLTSQQRTETLGEVEGELFERLVDPAGQLVAGDEIEYWFETSDNRTEVSRIRLDERPRVTRVAAMVTPPSYATGLTGAFLYDEALVVEPDASGVGVISPILAGSRVRVILETNKPASLDGEPSGWTGAGDRLVYDAIARDRVRLDVDLFDERGLYGSEPLAIVLDVVPDARATVTITDPPHDEAVLATASLPVWAKAEDDIGMRWLTIERRVATRPVGSEGGAPEPGAPVELVRVDPDRSESQRTFEASTSLDLAGLGVRVGDEVWLTALGRDTHEHTGTETADARTVRSTPRRLRIIDESTFIGQVQGELSGVRRAAIEIDAAQASIAESDAADADRSASTAERQQGVTDRLDAQRGTIERLRDRAERNALGDRTLEGMLEDATSLLEDAARASGEAASALSGDGDAEENASNASDEQQEVRDNLESLISMLDQGQDNWVARRTIESLLEEQRELAAETEAFGDQTLGRSSDQLSPEELTDLQRIAERQRDAANRAREALDALADRASDLERFDPAQADAMSQAARRGRQEGLEQQMRSAADQVQQNQTSAAAEAQQEAVDALEQMLEDIDAAEQARDQALRRVLADVLEALDALIVRQTEQIDALSRSNDEPARVGALVDPMVDLATGTLGLLDQIGPQRELANVVASVGLAADAQERAVVALRQGSADAADAAEREALARLREARDEAQRLEEQAQQRETARQRAELRQAYRQMLEMQVAIATDTEPWIGEELDRRSRAQVRALGQRQNGVGEALAQTRETIEGMDQAVVFELAHSRIERSSGVAAQRLLDADADAEVARRQATVVRLLQSLMESLAEDSQQQAFDEAQDGAGGGGSGSGGSGGDEEAPQIVPELAELKLLRAMQAETMEWTRNLDESSDRPAQGELGELAELQGQLAQRASELAAKLTGGEPAMGPSDPASVPDGTPDGGTSP